MNQRKTGETDILLTDKKFSDRGKMPFNIVRNDITKVSADAIVNTANSLPFVGRGTDHAIYKAAGYDELLAARKKIGEIEKGCSAWTPSFNLKNNKVKYIIHTVGTFYDGGNNGELDILRNCYKTALETAAQLKCKSVAIPLLSSGSLGFPKEIALQIAIDEISHFLFTSQLYVTLVVYDEASYKISENLFDDIQNFLDENNYEEDFKDVSFENRSAHLIGGKSSICLTSAKLKQSCNLVEEDSRPLCSEVSFSVDEFIEQSNNTLNFQNTLQNIIASKHLENSEVYTKALIDRKFFSKIISNKNYVPKKQTVMALGLALELSLSEYESFLASAGYAFMPSSKFDLIVKYCVMNGIYNLVKVDVILDDHGLSCFAPY